MTREEAIKLVKEVTGMSLDWDDAHYEALQMAIKALEQETKIKVLDRDEVIRKLGAVDIYQANAWITLLDDLEYLELKICEVEK